MPFLQSKLVSSERGNTSHIRVNLCHFYLDLSFNTNFLFVGPQFGSYFITVSFYSSFLSTVRLGCLLHSHIFLPSLYWTSAWSLSS
jgi:hypothetical protein